MLKTIIALMHLTIYRPWLKRKCLLNHTGKVSRSSRPALFIQEKEISYTGEMFVQEFLRLQSFSRFHKLKDIDFRYVIV